MGGHSHKYVFFASDITDEQSEGVLVLLAIFLSL